MAFKEDSYKSKSITATTPAPPEGFGRADEVTSDNTTIMKGESMFFHGKVTNTGGEDQIWIKLVVYKPDGTTILSQEPGRVMTLATNQSITHAWRFTVPLDYAENSFILACIGGHEE